MNFIVFLTLALLIHVSQAQTSPEDFLAPHNAARAEVNVEPLVWDENVATYARDYANQRAGDCTLVLSGGPFGENLAWGSGSLSTADAVQLWIGEKSNYDYQSNSCLGGALCGLYTQVVWRNSLLIGCASVTCNDRGTFVVCNYYPPGNVLGQRPF